MRPPRSFASLRLRGSIPDQTCGMKARTIAKKLMRSNPVTGPVLDRWLGRPRRLALDGVSFSVEDRSRTVSFSALVREFYGDVYGLRTIPFVPGDVVIDVGAHVGLESIYLAKKYPFLRIYSYEPVPQNFQSLQHNLAANSVTNVRAFPLAMTGDGREVEIWVDLAENSGGGGHDRPPEHFRGRVPFRAESTTLDHIFSEHSIDRCKLLKIDCEGAEHEILRRTEYLERVDHLSAEFHEDGHLRSQGHSIDGLVSYCEQFIPPERMRIVRDEH